LALATSLCAETFLLTQGGRIVGDLQNPDELPRKKFVIVTPEGGTITLAKDQVKQIVRQRPAEIEYEQMRPRHADTVESQWELAEWCRDHNLSAQRRTHLERILALDPEHAQARRLLGYVKAGGKWTTRQDTMEERGEVLYKGRRMTQQEIDQIEEKRHRETREREWVDNVRTWRNWLDSNRYDAAIAQFDKIDDPMAIKALVRGLDNSREDPHVKIIYIRSLARIGTGEALGILADCAMNNDDGEVRMACLELLKKKKDSSMVRFFVRYLGNRDNYMVHRAAIALRELGDPSAVGPLIDALITTHKTKISSGSPGQVSTNFGSGSTGRGGGMSVGGGPRFETKSYQNRPVLDALASLTNVTFAFDVDAWRAWFRSQKRPESIDVRRGE
jgi:hypothetical protein